MRIFALLSPSFGLHENVVRELRSRGHEVIVYEDLHLPYDPLDHFGQGFLFRYAASRFVDKKTTFWENAIREDCVFKKPFDFFLCINGVSFCKYLYDYLKSANKNLKAVLYTWDSNRYYRFNHNYKFFDRVYTFDPVDARKWNIGFLPIYWTGDGSEIIEKKYKVFFVGSYHSDRFQVISKIVDQLDAMKVSYYIKLFVPEQLPSMAKLRYFLCSFFHVAPYFRGQYEILNMKDKPSFIVHEPIPNDVFNQKLVESEVVIDTEQPKQNGLTGRMMMALGNGKKVITTNTSIEEVGLKEFGSIYMVDRENPKLDKDFLNLSLDVLKQPDLVVASRLDNWIDRLIDGR